MSDWDEEKLTKIDAPIGFCLPIRETPICSSPSLFSKMKYSISCCGRKERQATKTVRFGSKERQGTKAVRFIYLLI